MVDAVGIATCWGWAYDGGTVAPVEPMTALDVGLAHACGITALDSTPLCWGQDLFGETELDAIPLQAVSCGGTTTCAILENGHVDCWGEGIGRLNWYANYVSLAVGAGHACGVDDQGVIYCWGDDTFGQASPPG